MKCSISALFMLLCISVASCQTTVKQFVESFPANTTDEIIEFNKIFKGRCPEMTEAEALEYVFDGDTTKLYVTEVLWDGETETRIGICKEKVIPKKCFYRKYDSGFLIGYETYENGESEDELYSCGQLCIYDMNYEKKSSLCVSKVDDFEDYIQAFFNPHTKKIFISDILYEPCKSIMYKINMDTYQFEKINEYKWEGHMVSVGKQLEYLKWDSDFRKE